jgi:hypothetical protein
MSLIPIIRWQRGGKVWLNELTPVNSSYLNLLRQEGA